MFKAENKKYKSIEIREGNELIMGDCRICNQSF